MSAKRFGIPKSMITGMTQDLTQKHVSDNASASRRSQWAKSHSVPGQQMDGPLLTRQLRSWHNYKGCYWGFSRAWAQAGLSCPVNRIQSLSLCVMFQVGHLGSFLSVLFSSNWNLASHCNTKQEHRHSFRPFAHICWRNPIFDLNNTKWNGWRW